MRHSGFFAGATAVLTLGLTAGVLVFAVARALVLAPVDLRRRGDGPADRGVIRARDPCAARDAREAGGRIETAMTLWNDIRYALPLMRRIPAFMCAGVRAVGILCDL